MKQKTYPVAGNVYDKYGSTHPIVIWLMKGFFSAFHSLLAPLEIRNILEIGCGEGHLSGFMKNTRTAVPIEGVDISADIIKIAAENYPAIKFSAQSGYELFYKDSAFDLVVASEVLEHLEFPERAIAEIARITAKYCILSVPSEPLWRILNVMRCKYIGRLGNTPGHIQHWNRKRFLALLGKHLVVERVLLPTPWILVLCKKK